jgi:RNA 3'-terminal phosphate cyclase (ATP)
LNPVLLDGSEGEGGGQILRTALTLSLATGRPFVIENIRGNRKPPGLKAQHVASVLACAKLGSAEGAAVPGASRLAFTPAHRAHAGSYRFDIGTAGATGLLLHAVSFPLWLADGPTDLVLTGGTHADHAPCFDELVLGWAPLLARAGFPGSLELARPGYFPRGGGEVRVRIEPARPVRLELGAASPPVSSTVIARASGIPGNVGERLAARARTRLEARLGFAVPSVAHTDVVHTDVSRSPGCAVTVAVVLENGGRLAARALGERGKPAERVADEAVDRLLADVLAGGTVDEHLADQLLVPFALGAGGRFLTPRVTEHLRTNASVIGRFLEGVKIEILPTEDGGRALVSVERTS